jgi:hypothetical protein
MRRLIAASCLFIAACGEAMAQEMEIDPPNDRMAPAGGVWESSPWTGFDYLEYRGDARLRVLHTLDREPAVVLVYVSFERDGRDAALAAGDIARIEAVTADFVTLRNATEQRFFMRLVLQ